ncbi:hypothetical protein [Vibrio crassostreae]|uniref:hypothetical protein n=1 Tax=Vibrio crassostreae TaxID=246167 RepID=UPI001B30D369|nr:hypothetical protein [Vibrio crassostreae]
MSNPPITLIKAICEMWIREYEISEAASVGFQKIVTFLSNGSVADAYNYVKESSKVTNDDQPYWVDLEEFFCINVDDTIRAFKDAARVWRIKHLVDYKIEFDGSEASIQCKKVYEEPLTFLAKNLNLTVSKYTSL